MRPNNHRIRTNIVRTAKPPGEDEIIVPLPRSKTAYAASAARQAFFGNLCVLATRSYRDFVHRQRALPARSPRQALFLSRNVLCQKQHDTPGKTPTSALLTPKSLCFCWLRNGSQAKFTLCHLDTTIPVIRYFQSIAQSCRERGRLMTSKYPILGILRAMQLCQFAGRGVDSKVWFAR